MGKLGVVIVNFRTADLTIRCIDSLLEQRIALPADIVIVDNASGDGSGQAIASARPQVRTIFSTRNGGFGAGVNLGVEALDTELVLVLNPDTAFRENQVEEVRALFEREPSLGMLGLKLVNTDGSPQYSARRFYSLADIAARRTPLGRFSAAQRIESSHLLKGNWSGGPFESDWVLGTGFVVRRRAFDGVGRMDEGYFLYFEEVDLCARMWIAGWSVMALPSAELVHDHQRHSQAGIWSHSGRIHVNSMLRFFGKFGVPWLHRPSRQTLETNYLRWHRRSRGRAAAPAVPPTASLASAEAGRSAAGAT